MKLLSLNSFKLTLCSNYIVVSMTITCIILCYCTSELENFSSNIIWLLVTHSDKIKWNWHWIASQNFYKYTTMNYNFTFHNTTNIEIKQIHVHTIQNFLPLEHQESRLIHILIWRLTPTSFLDFGIRSYNQFLQFPVPLGLSNQEFNKCFLS